MKSTLTTWVTSPYVPALLVFAGVLLFGAAAPWVPALAVVAVLSVAPGWLLVSRVLPGLSAPGRLGLGVVVSVYFTAHLVNLVASLLGFGVLAIVGSFSLLALLTFILARVELPFLATPPEMSWLAFGRSLKADRIPFALAGVVGLVVLLILGLSAWHQTPNGWVSGGWNWSDFLVHVSIGSSIAAGNFPPQVPYFAGVPLTYHWFADFHGAIVASASGLSVIPVFIVSSAAMAGTLALVVWELARLLTGNRRVAGLAVILLCFGGGMGWIRLVGDVMAGAGDPWKLLGANPYDNTWADGWPFFKVASVLGTGFLPHRATTFGLPGFVAALTILVAALQTRRPAGVLLAGVIAALLAPFHFYAFPATYVVAGLYVVATGAWRGKAGLRDAALFLAPVALALPFVLGPISTQSTHGAFHFVLGWSQAPFKEGLPAAVFFYLTNLGLPVILGVGALLARGMARPLRVFLGTWALVMFLVPNFVVLSAVEFDMNKFFQLGFVATAIAAAILIVRWPRALIVAVLAFSAISPAAIAIWHVRSDTVALSNAQEKAAHFIAANTPQKSVFVTDAFINSPVDLVGRLRLSTFGPYASNLGYDPKQREKDITSIYCEGDAVARNLMARYGSAYVLSSGGVIDCGGEPQTDFDASALFTSIYRDGVVAIWQAK